MSNELQRTGDGRFAPRFGADLLIEIIRRVCEYVAAAIGIAPDAVTQAAFNDHRVSAGFPQAPRADKIATQLGISWRPLLEAVCRGGASTRQTLASAAKAERDPPDEERISYALTIVARRRGVSRLYPADYEAERALIEAESGRKWLHDTSEPLPTIGQITTAVKWDAALALAGLHVPPKRADNSGLPQAEAIEMFVVDLGYLPRSIPELRRYTRLKGVAVTERTQGGSKSIQPAIAVFAQSWRDRGRWVPPRYPREAKPPAWNITPLEDPEIVRRVRRWTIDACIESLVLALDELEKRWPGERLTQKRHREIARSRPEIVSPSTVDRVARNNGLKGSDLILQAARLRLERNA